METITLIILTAGAGLALAAVVLILAFVLPLLNTIRDDITQLTRDFAALQADYWGEPEPIENRQPAVPLNRLMPPFPDEQGTKGSEPPPPPAPPTITPHHPGVQISWDPHPTPEEWADEVERAKVWAAQRKGDPPAIGDSPAYPSWKKAAEE